MSEVKKLADKLKSAPTATSLSGLSTLLVNLSGEFVKTGTILLQDKVVYPLNLDEMEPWRIFVFDSLSNTVQGAPVRANGLLAICLYTYQIILRAGEGGKIYFRAYTSGVWQNWKVVV